MQAHQEDLGRWRLLSLMTCIFTTKHTFMERENKKYKKITAPGNSVIKLGCVVFYFFVRVAERNSIH